MMRRIRIPRPVPEYLKDEDAKLCVRLVAEDL